MKVGMFELCFAHVRPGVVKITAEDIEDSMTWTTEYGIYVVNGRGKMRGVRRPSPLAFFTRVLMFSNHSRHELRIPTCLIDIEGCVNTRANEEYKGIGKGKKMEWEEIVKET
jgi:hypothetical protein